MMCVLLPIPLPVSGRPTVIILHGLPMSLAVVEYFAKDGQVRYFDYCMHFTAAYSRNCRHLAPSC